MDKSKSSRDPLYYLSNKRYFGLAKSFLIEQELNDNFSKIIEEKPFLKKKSLNSLGTDVEKRKHLIQSTSEEDLMKICLSKRDLNVNILYKRSVSFQENNESETEVTALHQAFENDLSPDAIILLVEDSRFDENLHAKATFVELIPYLERIKILPSEFIRRYFKIFDVNHLNDFNQNMLMVLVQYILFKPIEESRDNMIQFLNVLVKFDNLNINQCDCNNYSVLDYCFAFDETTMSYSPPLQNLNRIQILDKLIQHPHVDFNGNYLPLYVRYIDILQNIFVSFDTEDIQDYGNTVDLLSKILTDDRFDQSYTDENGDSLLFRFAKGCLKSKENIGTNEFDYFFKVIKVLWRHHKIKQDSDGKTVFMWCMHDGELASRLLLSIQKENIPMLSDINTQDFEGKTALMHAIKKTHLGLLKLLLSQPMLDLDLEDDNQKTALMYALDLPKCEERPIILQLIGTDKRLMNTFGQDIKHGSTLYHNFVKEKYFDSLKILLNNRHHPSSNKVPLSTIDKTGKDILDLLVKQMHEDNVEKEYQTIIEMILDLPGVNINDTYSKGRTLLHKGTMQGCLPVIHFIFTCEHVDINIQDENGYSPLMYAVKTCDLPTVTKFLTHGLCDLSIETKEGKNVTDIVNCGKVVDPNLQCLLKVASEKPKSIEITLSGAVSILDQMKLLQQSIQSCCSMQQDLKKDLTEEITCMMEDIHCSERKNLQRGQGMNQIQRLKLRKLRPTLCEEVTPSNLLAHLIADDVIDEDIAEEIENEKSRRKKCEKLLSILPLRGSNAYGSFLKALEKEGQEYLSDMIKEFDPNKLKEQIPSDDEKQIVPFRETNVPLLKQEHPDIGEPYAIVPLRFLQNP